MTTADRFPANDYYAAFCWRRECCRALLELSQWQAQLIAAENYAELVELLQQKQHLVNELVGPPEALWRSWRSARTTLDSALRERCETVLDETDRLLKQVLQEEAAGTARLSSQQAKTADALAVLREGQQTASAYRPSLDRVARSVLDVEL